MVVVRGSVWAGGDLHVPERHPGVEGSHDEPGPQHVRVHRAGPGTFADGPDPPVAGAPVQPLTVAPLQHGAFVTFTDGQVDGSGDPGTSAMVAGLLPLPTMCKIRWPRCIPSSSTLAAQA